MSDLSRIGGIHYEMMRSCYNENHVIYKQYGAKGIRVCDEWHDRDIFRKWCNDNGYQRSMRIKRYDTTKDFEPSSCYLAFSENTLSSGVGRYARKTKKERNKVLAECNMERGYSKTRIYNIYMGMHDRCENPNSLHYDYYGKRGFAVCEEWSGKYGFPRFYKWAMEHGYKENLTIDRVDNTKGYCPENCRWVTQKVQCNNRRSHKKYNFLGEYLTEGQIQAKYGIDMEMIFKKRKIFENF